MAKYYKVDRFIKVQKIEESNKDRVEPDWVEVNADGSPLNSKTNKGEKKNVGESSSDKK